MFYLNNLFFFFFFNDTATTEIYTLSLHDALPIFHMVTHAIDQGVPAMAAATVLGVSGLSSMGGRIACGMIADRLGAKPTLLVGLALQAVMVFSYLFTRDTLSFYAAAVLFGISYEIGRAHV